MMPRANIISPDEVPQFRTRFLFCTVHDSPLSFSRFCRTVLTSAMAWCISLSSSVLVGPPPSSSCNGPESALSLAVTGGGAGWRGCRGPSPGSQ